MNKNYRIYAKHSITEHPDPGEFVMHAHEACEVYYFMSGKGVFHIEGTDYNLVSGDILLMDNTESHYIEISPDTAYERFVVHFQKDFVREFDASGKLMKVLEGRTPGKQNLFRSQHFQNSLYSMLINNMISSKVDDTTQIKTNLLALLNELATAFEHQSEQHIAESKTQANVIASYILENLNGRISLDTICERFYLSKSQLCRIFKKSMGSTVGNYIKVKRLILAKRLIDLGEPATKVFIKCGFNDYSCFYRAYKKQFSEPPSKRIHMQK